MSISISQISINSIGNGKHEIIITTPDNKRIFAGAIMRDYDGYFIYINEEVNGEEITRSIDAEGRHALSVLKDAKEWARIMILEAAGQERCVPTNEEKEYKAFLKDAKELIEGEKVHSVHIKPVLVASEKLLSRYVGKTGEQDLDRWDHVMNVRFQIGEAQGLDHWMIQKLADGETPHVVSCRDIEMIEEMMDMQEEPSETVEEVAETVEESAETVEEDDNGDDDDTPPPAAASWPQLVEDYDSMTLEQLRKKAEILQTFMTEDVAWDLGLHGEIELMHKKDEITDYDMAMYRSWMDCRERLFEAEITACEESGKFTETDLASADIRFVYFGGNFGDRVIKNPDSMKFVRRMAIFVNEVQMADIFFHVDDEVWATFGEYLNKTWMDEVPRFSEYRFNKSSDSWLKDEQYLKDWAQKMALTYYRFYACGQILEEEKREREALLADDIKHFQDLIDFNTGLMKDELEEDYPDFQRIKAYAEECHDYQCNIIGIQEYKLTFEELGRLTQEDIDAKLTLQNVHLRYI